MNALCAMWSATAAEFQNQRPDERLAAKADQAGQPSRREIRRLNRTYRRRQREFERALDQLAHDPAGRRELQTSWTLGR